MTSTERQEFTTRVLLSLRGDLVKAEESVRDIKVKITALAKEYGISLVDPGE